MKVCQGLRGIFLFPRNWGFGPRFRYRPGEEAQGRGGAPKGSLFLRRALPEQEEGEGMALPVAETNPLIPKGD